MIKHDLEFNFDHLRGVNQDIGRLPDELPDCKNIIGEPRGFSVWGGQSRFTVAEIGAQCALYSTVWPNEHESLISFGSGKLQVIEAGNVMDISEDLTWSTDPRNPTHMTKFLFGRYLIGSHYLRDQAWYWDGENDRPAKPLTTPEGISFRVVESWARRLWGIDAEDFPLQAHYGDKDKLEIKAGQWMGFRDNPLASRLVGMRPYSQRYAYFWGDRGLWQLEWTGRYPDFAHPSLLHRDCDCVSNRSIVHIPGKGFAWEGQENIWLLSGGQIRKIDISPDTRQARRIRDALAARSLSYLHLSAGFYCRQRNLVIFSHPTKGCTKQNPWESPKSVAWRPTDDTWWLIDQGWQSVAEVIHAGKRELVGTDEDGFLYLLDHNLNQDKISTPLEWYADLERVRVRTGSVKWLQAILRRPHSGADKVMVSFWAKQQATPIEKRFSLADSYSDISQRHLTFLTGNNIAGTTTIDVQDTTGFPDSGIVRINDAENRKYWSKTDTTLVLHNSLGGGDYMESPLENSYLERTEGYAVEIKDFDPGGPNDNGLPPDPDAVLKTRINLVGPELKIRLSNQDGDDFYNGPPYPMTSLTVLGERL